MRKPSVTDMRNPVDGASAESTARYEMKEVSKHEMEDITDMDSHSTSGLVV